MQPARSLVIAPLSTVCTHTFSRVCANLQGIQQGEALACLVELWAAPAQALPRSSPDEVLVPIQLSPMLQTPCPGKDAGNRVGTGGPALGTGHRISQEPDTAIYPPDQQIRLIPQATRASGLQTLKCTHYLLVLSVMAGDCPMSSLSLNCLPIRADQHRCHQTEGAKAWGLGRFPLRAVLQLRTLPLRLHASPLQLRGQ